MIVIDQSIEILKPNPTKKEEWIELGKSIERYGRVCYKSEDKITNESWKRFITHIVKSGHHSVIEHGVITIKIITNRGVSHEIVRHRLASYSQESTRYVNYSKDGLTVIRPVWFKSTCDELNNHDINYTNIPKDERIWYEHMLEVELLYNNLINNYKWKQEQAREVLPNAIKTELVMTANLREWLHVINLRTTPAAHPQIRDIFDKVKLQLSTLLPEVFA